jgi:hypothetical protein
MKEGQDALDAITDAVLSYRPPRKKNKNKPEKNPTSQVSTESIVLQGSSQTQNPQKSKSLPGSEILIYQSPDGKTRIDVRVDGDTVWLSQAEMAELFQVKVPNVNEHIKNIYAEGELSSESTIRNFRMVRQEGTREVSREIENYNLDVIISVGYRVKSHRGTQFRIWATKRLREYIVKGFTLDDERLKDGGTRKSYFDELIERVRAIRTSERNFYRKITDIYATSYDYDGTATMSQHFFSTVQNKFHWAITHHTAAELIAERADARRPNMGLTSWRGDKIRKSDVTVAKNYLSVEELAMLNLIVDQYLSFAELQARQHKPMYMADWIKKLDQFLTLNDREILKNAGTISAKLGDEIAAREFQKYSEAQDKIDSAESVGSLEGEVQSLRVARKAEE